VVVRKRKTVSIGSGELLQELAGIGSQQAGRDRLVIRRAERSDEDAARALFAVRWQDKPNKQEERERSSMSIQSEKTVAALLTGDVDYFTHHRVRD
jgi:hypothetical protein